MATHNNNKHSEPMFIVILRSPQAKSLLNSWLNANKSAQARVEEHRMQIMDHNTLNLFMVTWTHNWDDVTIWGTWNRRHI